MSRIFSPKNTNFPSPCIQRNLPATVRNFDLLCFCYSKFHCATKWEVGSATPARKSLRCLVFKNVLLERTCRGADAVRWIKRPAELRVACLTDKTIYGYQANHKTYAFQTRTSRTAKVTTSRSNKHFFKPRSEAPSGSNQAPVQSYIGNFPQQKYEADDMLFFFFFFFKFAFITFNPCFTAWVCHGVFTMCFLLLDYIAYVLS